MIDKKKVDDIDAKISKLFRNLVFEVIGILKSKIPTTSSLQNFLEHTHVKIVVKEVDSFRPTSSSPSEFNV